MSQELRVLDSCEADEVWSLIRLEVGAQLFPRSMVPVPYIQDAERYDLLHVLIKQSGLLRSRLMPVGLLANLLESTADPSLNLIQNLAHTKQTEQGRQDLHYEQVVTDRGVQRILKASIAGITKSTALFLVNLGELYLSQRLPWLHSVKSIYIVNQVYLASNLQLSSTYGDQQMVFKTEYRLPIGFTCKKFTVTSKGLIMEERRIKKPLVKATFIKNTYFGSSIPQSSLSHGSNPKKRLAKDRTANQRRNQSPSQMHQTEPQKNTDSSKNPKSRSKQRARTKPQKPSEISPKITKANTSSKSSLHVPLQSQPQSSAQISEQSSPQASGETSLQSTPQTTPQTKKQAKKQRKKQEHREKKQAREREMELDTGDGKSMTTLSPGTRSPSKQDAELPKPSLLPGVSVSSVAVQVNCSESLSHENVKSAEPECATLAQCSYFTALSPTTGHLISGLTSLQNTPSSPKPTVRAAPCVPPCLPLTCIPAPSAAPPWASTCIPVTWVPPQCASPPWYSPLCAPTQFVPSAQLPLTNAHSQLPLSGPQSPYLPPSGARSPYLLPPGARSPYLPPTDADSLQSPPSAHSPNLPPFNTVMPYGPTLYIPKLYTPALCSPLPPSPTLTCSDTDLEEASTSSSLDTTTSSEEEQDKNSQSLFQLLENSSESDLEEQSSKSKTK